MKRNQKGFREEEEGKEGTTIIFGEEGKSRKKRGKVVDGLVYSIPKGDKECKDRRRSSEGKNEDDVVMIEEERERGMSTLILHFNLLGGLSLS